MDNIVTVGGHINASINFAMQQNYVPVIRSLVVNNNSEETLENIGLKITFEPEFAKEFTYYIGSIPAKSSAEISPVRISTNTDLLFSLTEKMVGNITIEVLQNGENIFTYQNTIELLACDQWSGLNIMPEMIAAFVTPNHPALSPVIHEASTFLKKWKGDPSFTGYQTNNPNNVKLQMAAIFAALVQQKIVYNDPPASYEVIGQRIRLPHKVLEQKMGTCLDLAVLYAACLEAVGLHPLLFFMTGHAFCGCWLENETFADCCVDDVSAIEKRIAENAEEMLLVECTDFVDSNVHDVERFDHAMKHGKDHISNMDFQCVIDIIRTRGSGIRPIPLRPEQTYSGMQLAEESDKPKEMLAPSELNSSLLGKVAEGNDKPVTKIRIWERKLLDFSLRNSLLNFRVTKNTMQLMTADLGKLEDELASGSDFRIMEIPTEWTVSTRDAKIFAIENEKDLVTNIAENEFKNNRIRTFLNEADLDSALKSLYRSAKVSMEENGSNTLFLALGLLRWYESDLSEKPRYAPLVLIPIDIVRNTRNKGYIIRSRQEETQINVTLLEYLRQDHGISITGLDPLPLDEHGIDLPLVFNTIRQAVMGKKRWNIEEYAFIGLFSFSQFVMWNDLRNRSEEISQNKMVSSLMAGSLTYVPEDISITPENIDSDLDLENMAVPMSADSSQLAAIAAAGSGQSFVLHGPPGTGKSQTITNMIANALYNDKSVLFVAEKMAALNVVQKRLANLGLDPFCLELHSNKTNKTTVLAELGEILDKLCTISEKKDFLRSLPSDVTALLTGIYMNEQTDWNVLEKAVSKTDSIMNAIKQKAGADPAQMAQTIGKANCTSEGQALSSFLEKLSAFEDSFSANMTDIEASADWLGLSAEKLNTYAENADKLRYAAQFNSVDKELSDNGLSGVSESYRTGKVDSENVEKAFSCTVNYQLALMIINGDKRLSQFSSNSANDLITQFKDTLDKFSRLTIQELLARLSAKIPAQGSACASTSEMGILKRAIKSNGRMMSLRSLFDKIPNLLRKLCPCMLMSPISVAQYIDPSFPKFDLVIFDEASQLPTAEAAGTIARGENVVIVGDPKQLPPTNFFSSNRIDEENSEKEDLESLLDDCLAISMPQQYLKWHYRSRHESLIAYSNMKYYDNKLLTFPSHNDLISKVSIVHPEGHYDKGRTKQNKAEARAVVDEIIRRMSDEKLRNDSIGVVTFSSVQQNLIDDMLCEEWANHPELEELDRKSPEPVFIKNLENVQGDERDVILFSIGYGPDEKGQVSMNFGPLNRDGGWRRLNVAISRARKAMIVYSVLRPEQIDLSRTRSEGVAGLKGFLEFAERGKLAVTAHSTTKSTSDSTVTECIAKAIKELGYGVKCNIGSSEFKVDIGIIDPDNEKEYLLGILLDGENTLHSSTAQDRFILQPSVLNGLGWNILRVWTLDWFDDKDRVLKNIKAAIDSAPKHEAETAPPSKPAVYSTSQFEKEEASTLTSAFAQPYVAADIGIMGTSDDFYKPENKQKIRETAEKMIAVEAPISEKLFMRKVFTAWGITRSGSRVESIFADAAQGVSPFATADENRVFLWKEGQSPESYSIYRTSDDTNKRSMEDIPSEEIINAVKEVLCQQISLSEADLVRETAKKFGYTRAVGTTESVISYTLKKALTAGLIKKSESGNISAK